MDEHPEALAEPLTLHHDDSSDLTSKPESPPRMPFYVGIVQAANLHAFLIGYTASFTSPTLSQMVTDLSICGRDWDAKDDGLCEKAAWVASVINLSALCGALAAGDCRTLRLRSMFSRAVDRLPTEPIPPDSRRCTHTSAR